MIHIHPAVALAFEVWGWLFAIAFVLYCIFKLDAKMRRSNNIIEHAKTLPGGLNYDPDQEEADEAALEEAWYKAHA